MGQSGSPPCWTLKEHGHVCLESRVWEEDMLKYLMETHRSFWDLEWVPGPTSEPSSSEARKTRG